MAEWIVPTLLATVFWASVSLLSKFSDFFDKPVPSGQKGLLLATGTIAVSAVLNSQLSVKDFTSLPPAALACSVAAGACSGLGMAYYQKGLQVGDVSTVTALSGLYPALVFAVSVVAFGETVTAAKCAGLVFALLSGFCFSL